MRWNLICILFVMIDVFFYLLVLMLKVECLIGSMLLNVCVVLFCVIVMGIVMVLVLFLIVSLLVMLYLLLLVGVIVDDMKVVCG